VKPVNEAESTEPRRAAIERELEGAIAFEQVVSGVIELPTLAVVASPTGFANMWERTLAGVIRRPPRWSRMATTY